MKKILTIIFAMSLALTFNAQPANAQAAKAITKLVKSATKVKPKVKPTPVRATTVRPTTVKSSGSSRKLNGADDAVRLIPCTTCNGSGYVYYNYNRYTCTSCRGTGKLVSRR